MKTVINLTTLNSIIISPHNWSNIDPFGAPIPRVLGDWSTVSVVNQYNIYYTLDEGQEGFWQNFGPANGSFLPIADGVNIITDATPPPNTNYFIRQSQKFDGIVNVFWFGALGDGLNDDHDAIQSALDFISKTDNTNTSITANFGGGTVFLPKGEYIITETLLIGQNCRLLGVSNRYHYPYLGNFGTVHPSGAGTLIRANLEDPNKWVISSATLNLDSASPNFGQLLPYDIALFKSGGSIFSFDNMLLDLVSTLRI
jgi:hypothetical protein